MIRVLVYMIPYDTLLGVKNLKESHVIGREVISLCTINHSEV